MCPTAPTAPPAPSTPVSWPNPAVLEGVKSRKRVIFDVARSFFKSSEETTVNTFSGLKLSLESRISACGKVGLASIGLLLGDRTVVRGTVTRHDGLAVVHLGPHLVETKEPSEHDYMLAISAALERCPQVVILEEAACADNKAWNHIFESLLRSEGLNAFRGAVVVCAAEETEALKRICMQRWTGANEYMWQEDIADDEGLELLEDVLNMQGADVLDEPFMKEVTALAWQDPFNEDLLQKAEEKDWIVSVLTKPSANTSAPEGTRALAGFICYKIRPGRVFHIARIAVPEPLRKAGHGKRLMRWVLEKTAQLPRSEVAWIELSAVVDAVPFYENFGFMDMTCDDLEAEGYSQTWMEMPNISNAVEIDED